MIITIKDCRAAGHCPRGILAWFRVHGLDFRHFLRNGISEELFLSFGDAQAANIVFRAKERGADG